MLAIAIANCASGRLVHQFWLGPRIRQRAFPIPARYQSTKHGHREFCSACGTQIAYRNSQNATTVEVNVGSLDDCDQVQPRYHIWCASRIPWFDIADNLPRYEGSKPKRDE